MREEFKKALHELRSPYVYLWAIASPAITLLSPDEPIKVGLLATLVLGTTGAWLLDRHRKHRKLKPNSSPRQFLTAIQRSVEKAVHYLEHAENKTEHDQRYRISPSVMETTTVIGAIILGKHYLGRDHDNNERGLAWIFETLKSQFSGTATPERLAGFDCPKCRGNNECNVAFFDYLSHLAYCKGESLYDSFIEHFSSVGTTLRLRLHTSSGDIAGWPAKNGDSIIDPFATATALHLCVVFGTLEADSLCHVARWLITSQEENGSWKRPSEAVGYCGSEYPVITTHRVIEVLSLCHKAKELSNVAPQIQMAISKGAQYLLSSPLLDAPVSYDRHAGYTAPEIYRIMGHMVQGLTKAGSLNSMVLRERISYIVNSQRDDGAFPTSSNVITSDRNLIHYTDITAFLTRTLVFYAVALQATITDGRGKIIESAGWQQVGAKLGC